MKPLEIYGPLKYAKTAFDVLEMLTDKKKSKEVMEVLEGIEKEREKLNEAIALYGKAKSIERLHNNAVEKDVTASRLLEGAEAEAKEICASAQKEIDGLRSKVKLREDAAVAQEKMLDEREAKLTSSFAAYEARLTEWEGELVGKETKLSSRTDALRTRESVYRDRKKALVELGAQAKAIPAL